MAIWVELNGGLGNQLFEYAFAKSLEVNFNHKVKLNIAKNYFEGSYRNLELDQYNISLSLEKYQHNISLFDRIRVLTIADSAKRKAFRNKIKTYPQTKSYDDFVPAIDMNTIKDNDYLIGCFQKPQYFKNLQEILQKEFTLKLPLDNQNLEMLDRIKNTNSVSLHIRRGDYIQANSDNANVLSESYFEKAIITMQKHIGDDFTLYVFTEDFEWARASIRAKQDIVFVDINDSNSAIFDLELMKNCKHNILSNSTFAWWGAYLNSNKDKVIISPKEFFKGHTVFNAEIYCDEWIKI